MVRGMKFTDKAGAVRFEVHAKPKASQSAIVAADGDALAVRIAAPPVDGAANAELVRFLPDVLGVPKRQVELLRGESSRAKLIAVHGLDEETVRARLLAARA
jgi:uncharacterized protein (TIGR00251 family)